MYKFENLVFIMTMLECIEKCWIYTKDFENANDLAEANDQKELLNKFLEYPHYKHLKYLNSNFNY